MRVWFINPGYLDQKRLVAAHREIHMLKTCVSRGREWGPTRFLKFSMPFCKAIHDITIDEMATRKTDKGEIANYENDFLLDGFQEIHRSIDFQPTEEQTITDIKQLREKWELEEYYYGVGRLDLADLEKIYGIEGKTSFLEAKEIQAKTRELVKMNRTWFEEFRKRKPKSRMQDRIQAFRNK